MGNKLKHLSSVTAGTVPPTGTTDDRGRLAINFADGKLYTYNASGTPQLLGQLVTAHSPTKAYRVDDLMVRDNVQYRCVVNIPPKAFSAADWVVVGDFRGELLFRAPSAQAQASMAMADPAVGMQVQGHTGQTAPVQTWRDGAGNPVADIRADAYPGAAFGRPVFRVNQIAHGLTAVGQPVRYDGSNWVLAIAATQVNMATAVVHRVINADAVELQTAGRIDGLQVGAFEGSTITPNTRYYASTSTPGLLTPTAPPNPAQENVVLTTIDSGSAILGLQVPGSLAQPDETAITVTQTPNPFTLVGQPAAFDGNEWVLADPTDPDKRPLGLIRATSGDTFSVLVSGLISDIAAAAVDVAPLVPGATYFVLSSGLLSQTVDPADPLPAGILLATAATAGIVLGPTDLQPGVQEAISVSQKWLLHSSAYTASPGDQIAADVSGGAWTLTLPASPSAGDAVTVAVIAGDAEANNLTVDGNGADIVGEASAVLDISLRAVAFVFDGVEWRVSA